MPDTRPQPGASLLFLREEELRAAQDLLFFASRDLAALTAPLLAQHGLGRAHHRALHFIARRPGGSVTDLLTTLHVTKQSLNRTLGPLLARGLVAQSIGRADRRQRLLTLTEDGAALERALFALQREHLLRAFRDAGPAAVEGFSGVLRRLTREKG